MRKRYILIIAILLMAIGYAVVATNLAINGQTSIGANTFEVVFTKAVIDGEDISSTAISKSGIELNFATRELINVGETSTLEFIVTNTSRQYDGTVEINCSLGTNKEYYNVETEFPEFIKAGTSEYGSLTVIYSKASTEKIQDEIECSLTFNANEKKVEEIDLGEIYQDETLNGADPVLKKALATYALDNETESSKELIPVVIADDGEVKYANIHTRWYSYENKEWANAVILTDDAKAYSVGEVIPEDEIESYFVWIPKYKYQLWNVGTTNPSKTAHSIEIIFGTEDTEDIEGESCATPMVSGETGNCDNGEYMTHPAFITLGVNGIWVGKYETGYKGANSKVEDQQNNSNSSNIIVKPAVYSWRSNTIKNMFVASYNYNRELDSHMMKNTEWGAVAYLSHSKYGIDSEININNNNVFKTGYSSLPSLNQQTYPGIRGDSEDYNQPYNTGIGYLASTTGNITGIYDMSGGTLEYMSSPISGKLGASGFATITDYNVKYFDLYNTTSSMTTYQNRILGDATGEMGPFNYFKDGDNNDRWHNSWYSDASDFVESTYPWIVRGGFYSHGILAGQFDFIRHTGEADSTFGFRIVLSL